jgi:hypothetical protein
MAIPLLVGSHDEEILSTGLREGEQTITASGWAGRGKLLLAAYNGGPEGTSSRITVAAKALQSAGIGRTHKRETCLLSRAGRPLPDRKVNVNLSATDGLRATVGLGKGEAVLCKVLIEA